MSALPGSETRHRRGGALPAGRTSLRPVMRHSAAVSLNTRLLIAASLVLVGFLGLAGLSLDRAYRESAEDALREQLQTQVFMLLGAAELDESGRLVLPQALPEARLSAPGSGLYARVADARGHEVWRSRSLLGLEVPFPLADGPGVPRYARVTASDQTRLSALGFGVIWETRHAGSRRYTFQVALARTALEAQVTGFRRTLSAWLAGSAAMLLVAQGLILRWGLAPLRNLAHQVREIEAGRRTLLSGPFAPELQGLADNLNRLVEHNHEHLERYRNALGDLAHSLKTPLAVLRGATEGRLPETELRETIGEQVGRMGKTVEYQLQRAATAGRGALATAVPIAPLAVRLVRSLEKVYTERGLHWSLEVPDHLGFHGDEGDLMEVLGNLLDNAGKWAGYRIVLRARPAAGGETLLEVEDDGPGIPEPLRARVLHRGERLDHAAEGQGIGLAVVREVVLEAYRGRMEIDRGPWGGARVRIWL